MRKDAREVALRVLYSKDYFVENDFNDEIFSFNTLNKQDKEFCQQLIETVNDNKQVLLQDLSQISHNYSLERMFEVDKQVLLLAMAEIKFFKDIPILVTIKEAIELSKKYSSEDSVTFINGILAVYKENLEKLNG